MEPMRIEVDYLNKIRYEKVTPEKYRDELVEKYSLEELRKLASYKWYYAQLAALIRVAYRRKLSKIGKKPIVC